MRLVGLVAPFAGMDHPVRGARRQDGGPRRPQVAEQVAPGAALAGGAPVADPFVHAPVKQAHEQPRRRGGRAERWSRRRSSPRTSRGHGAPPDRTGGAAAWAPRRGRARRWRSAGRPGASWGAWSTKALSSACTKPHPDVDPPVALDVEAVGVVRRAQPPPRGPVEQPGAGVLEQLGVDVEQDVFGAVETRHSMSRATMVPRPAPTSSTRSLTTSRFEISARSRSRTYWFSARSSTVFFAVR